MMARVRKSIWTMDREITIASVGCLDKQQLMPKTGLMTFRQLNARIKGALVKQTEVSINVLCYPFEYPLALGLTVLPGAILKIAIQI